MIDYRHPRRATVTTRRPIPGQTIVLQRGESINLATGVVTRRG